MKHIFGYIYMFIGVAIVTFMSCSHADGSHMSVREAQEVVVQADSLWHNGQMYGVDEGDSATLAHAYETLKRHSAFSCQRSEFAHACYHYGKLLRAKDDPVAAMQTFINATHSHTRDYHILGRVYSNMGSICHLAGEYQLSYDMFEKSANMFLRNGDTLSYYYGLNEMAFELAEQGKKEEAIRLINDITTNCNDKFVHRKTTETKALLYRNIGLYDSVINEINILQKQYSLQPHEFVLKAYAFWFLEQPDSALFYAKCIMDLPNSANQDRYNMLYILLNGDSTLDTEEIKALSEQRADLEMDKLVPIHKKHAVAIELLEQDLNRKPDWRWLYAILITLILIGIGSSIYIRTKHKRHQLLSQRIEDLENKNKENQLQLQTQIEDRRRLIATSPNIAKTLNWNNFEQMCLLVDQNFNMLASKLRNKHVLNETEIRLCILVFIGLNRAQISLTLPYARSSIGKLKDHTAKQLGTTGKNLQHFLFNMATEK